MKVCPNCNQTYSDESLNFCLNDGTMLTQVQTQDAPPTVVLNQPRQTAGNYQNQPNTAPNNWQTPSYQTPPNQVKPKKKSKALIWILGIFGTFLVLGGIGFVGLLAWLGANIDSLDNSNDKKTIKKTETPKPTTKETQKTSSQKDDLSNWEYSDATLGTADYSNGKLLMNSATPRYIFVLATFDKNFVTENATSKLTVTNQDNISTTFGYGIIVQSNPDTPLKSDFAFAIDSKTQRYRIVKHVNKKETILSDWKKSNAIKAGTESNVLEVNTNNNELKFSINGEYVTTIKDNLNENNGIIGLYVSDTSPVSFSDMEISK